MRPITVWQGDEHILRMNVDEVNDGDSVGDLNLGGIVSFSYSIGVPGQWPLVNRTYLTDDIVNGADSSGNVIVPIVGDDTRDMTPGRYTFQVWMTQEDGREYTILECDIDVKDKLKDDSQGSGDSVVFVTSISTSITLGQPTISGGSNVVYPTGIPSTSGVGSPTIGTEANEHWIFSPDDASLKTLSWLTSQPSGTFAVTFSNLSDSYHGYPEFAPGQGRNGKNAIKLPCAGMTETGLPNFLVYPAVSTGGSYTFAGDDRQFVIPRDKRVNRLEVWLRFPAGFRATTSTSEAMTQNLHWGTYCSRPGGTGGNLAIGVEQSFWDGIVHGPYAENGWHYYHQAKIRHDIVDDNEWIKVVFHGAPTHLRGVNDVNMPMNPNGPHGEYFKCLTYFYIHFPPTWWYYGGSPGFQYGGPSSEPEVAVPFDIYCDSIRFYWHDEYQPCEIRFGSSGDWYEGQEVEAAASPTVNNIPFRVTNVTGSSVTGRLAWRGRMSLGMKVVDQITGTPFDWSSITLAAGETKHYWLRFTSALDAYPNNPEICGVVFEPDSEFVGVGPTNADPTWGQSRRSKMSGDRVQVHAIQGVGGLDYDTCYRSITVLKNGGTNISYRPTSLGGVSYEVPTTVTSQFQLPGHRPGGGSMTFAKGQSQSGRGTLTISSSGLVTYTPPSAGWTGTCHFSYQINGSDAKPSIWYGAWVVVSA